MYIGKECIKNAIHRYVNRPRGVYLKSFPPHKVINNSKPIFRLSQYPITEF